MSSDHLSFRVSGMTCDHCARTVEKSLSTVDGVAACQVSYPQGRGEATLSAPVPWETLRDAVRSRGYDLLPDTGSGSGSPPSPEPLRVVIIGAGSGAFAAAIRASELGATVTLVERGTIGGTCVNVGCVPSKILVRQAQEAHQAAHPSFVGLTPASLSPSASLLARQRKLRVDELRKAKYSDILAELPGVAYLPGEARLLGAKEVEVRGPLGDTTRLLADRILIATGSRPQVPPVPGLSETPFWTSTEALFSESIPPRLVILGGGFVAAEIGQSFQRLGAQVTVIMRGGHLLSRTDPDLGRDLQGFLAKEGIRFLTGAFPEEVRFSDGLFRVTMKGEVLEAEHLLVATGRIANTESLDLQRVGIETDSSGSVVVNERLETTLPGVYATGDCTTLPKFVYVAAAAGTRAATNMAGNGPVTLDLSVLPEVIFTDPQVATVGLTEAQAQAAGLSVETRTLPLDQVPRALANFETRGWIRMVAEAGSGRLLGVQILSPEAGEMIQTAALAISSGRTVDDIGGMLFPYLTMVEGLKLCAQSFRKEIGMLSCCAG